MMGQEKRIKKEEGRRERSALLEYVHVYERD